MLMDTLKAYWPDRWESPENLWWLAAALVVVVIVAVLVRVVLLRIGRKEFLETTDDEETVEELAPSFLGRFARVSPWLIVLIALGVALSPLFAGPVRVALEEFNQSAVVLAVDTSPSAGALEPGSNDQTRRSLMVEAVREFISNASETLQVALVTFDENVQVRIPPTTDRVALNQALNDLEELEFADKGNTALGEAMSVSLDVAARVPLADDGTRPVRVVILSDGDSTVGVEPEEVWNTPLAKEIGINAVAFGTNEGYYLQEDGDRSSVKVDPDTLEAVARETNGAFRLISDSSTLSNFYEEIGESIGYREVTVDAWQMFPVLAVIIALVAAIVAVLTRTQLFSGSASDDDITEEAIADYLLSTSANT